MATSRRKFLATAGAALAATSLPPFRPEPAEAAARERGAAPAIPPVRPGRLVVVQLAGGNDGINTVVPFADPLYRTLRPRLALPEQDLVRLDGRTALHPALAPLARLFEEGRLAVVRGVGVPNPDRSHFVSTAIWQSGRIPASRDGSGWLGRAAERTTRSDSAAGPLESLGVGAAGLTPALYAPGVPVPALLSLDAFALKPDRRYPGDAPALRRGLSALYSGAPAGGQDAMLRRVGGMALSSSDLLRSAASGWTTKAAYPRGAFGDQLRLAAQLLGSAAGARVVHVTLGGFDTHANQLGQHRGLLSQLAEGIVALLDDLAEHGCGDVTVLTYSEFGRRAQENGSAGTDHGAGSVLFVAGERVLGGLYGPPTDLSTLSSGDVPVAVDFREVYAAVLEGVLGVAPDTVLGPGVKPQPILRRGQV